MKMRLGLLMLVLVLLLVVFGCSTSSVKPVQNQSSVENDVVEKTSQPVKVDSEVKSVSNKTVETTKGVIGISGSLDLQSDLNKCTHLKKQFSCDKYDIRKCKFKQIVGNEFYPDHIFCRAGDALKGEVKANKYCYIQECLNILDKGVVRSVGGLVVNAEYSYSETKNADIGGIITQYKLLNCGTINKTFENKEKCNFYYSELNDLQEGWTK